MNTNAIVTSAKNALGKHLFKVQKYSPEILVVTGVVGAVTSTVFACKATLKVNTVLDEHKENTEKIHKAIESKEISEEEYSELDAKKDLTRAYAQTGIKLAKLYAPALTIGAVSIGCIFGSTHLFRRRNFALAAAYAGIDKSFKEYRKRVTDRFGDQVDKELKYDIKAAKITEVETDEEGKEKKVKKVVDATNASSYSDYARFFDELNPLWENDAEYNLTFLKSQQQFANDLLRSRGNLFLNEVYDMIGIPRSKAGQVVGWVYNKENPVGDNYVDFGLYDIKREVVRDFVNGYEAAILLDFNVDGYVLDLI